MRVAKIFARKLIHFLNESFLFKMRGKSGLQIFRMKHFFNLKCDLRYLVCYFWSFLCFFFSLKRNLKLCWKILFIFNHFELFLWFSWKVVKIYKNYQLFMNFYDFLQNFLKVSLKNFCLIKSSNQRMSYWISTSKIKRMIEINQFIWEV